MLIRIEKGSAVPISSQIAEQIATLCASGKLASGDRLPSVRELARELAVNQNTVLRVYERLVRDGILEMRHGQGTFVADDNGGITRAAHRKRLIEELRQVARQGVALGLDADDLHELLTAALEQVLRLSKSKTEPNKSEVTK
jgi:GntR family transcriptional regulator